MKKKLITVILALSLCTLAACGENTVEKTDGGTVVVEEASEPGEAEAADEEARI